MAEANWSKMVCSLQIRNLRDVSNKLMIDFVKKFPKNKEILNDIHNLITNYWPMVLKKGWSKPIRTMGFIRVYLKNSLPNFVLGDKFDKILIFIMQDLTRKFRGHKALVRYLVEVNQRVNCLLYTSPSPRDGLLSRMPSSA